MKWNETWFSIRASAILFQPPVITWNASCRPPANTKPKQTGFLVTQLALGLIIILWKCGYFCHFHIPNYFCYSNISLALMSQILYLNSVRFLFFVPSEDCSCKIHGLRVGITRASRGWTYQVHSLLVLPLFFPCSLLLMGVSAGRKGTKVIYMWVIRILGLCKCIFVWYLWSRYQGRRTMLTRTSLYIFMNHFSSQILELFKWQGDPLEVTGLIVLSVLDEWKASLQCLIFFSATYDFNWLVKRYRPSTHYEWKVSKKDIQCIKRIVSLISGFKWHCTVSSGAILSDSLLSVNLMYSLRGLHLPHSSAMHEPHCDLIPFTCTAG